MKHTIKPHERGHRAPLSQDGQSVSFAIRCTERLKIALLKVNTDKVRESLTDLAVKEGKYE